MSISSGKSYLNRQTLTSDITYLGDFNSRNDIFEDNNEKTGTKSDEVTVPSEPSLATLTTSSSFDDGEIEISEPKESISSIQELLFYVYENEGRDSYYQTNEYNDFMRIEIPRESFCDSNKINKLKREENSSMQLSKAHCICPIASHILENKDEDSQNLKCSEPPPEHKKISKYPFVFEVEPYSLLFLNCKPGKTYVKSIKITNRSELYQKFDVSPLPKHSPFEMKIIVPAQCKNNAITSGLSFKIVVTYFCKNNESFEETLRIEADSISPIIIKVRAQQCPPILAELGNNDNFDEMTGEQVVACNSCLPTETTVTRLELVNFSKTYQFLILDKEMWSTQSLDNLFENDNKLVSGVFTIYPAYFQSNSEATIVINIQFSPKKAGKYCKKLYIVCDNMSVKTLQLIGQAYQFDKSMLEFLNMDKNYRANLDDFIEAEYFLNVGSIYRGKTKTKAFTVVNKSTCSLNFHWELHRYPLRGFKKMTSRMIKFSHGKGIFIGKKSKTFSVTVNMIRSNEGDYRTLACLYVDNLTGEKVEDLSKRNLLNRSQRKGYSLLVAIVEIHVKCKCVRIEATTQVIDLGRIPLLCGPQHKYSTQITVKNRSSIPVRCVWTNSLFDKENRVKFEIQPSPARITAKAGRIFVVSITGMNPGRFRHYLTCKANGNDCRVSILVEGECTMGFLHVRDDFIDCGIIKKDEKLRVDLSFENYTNCKWSRILSEYRYHSQKSYKNPKFSDKKRKICKKFAALLHIKRGLYDNFKRLITFQYNRVNTIIEKNVIWCSLLKWKVGDAVDYIGVIADIQRPLVTLSEKEISDDNMLMNYTSIIRLQLWNHSKMPASFTWCKPIGDQSSYFECKFEPAEGIVKQFEEGQVLVYLTPFKMITVEDLYFICIVDGMVSPLLVSLTGVVQPVIMELNWKENLNDTEQLTMIWQSMGEDSEVSNENENSKTESNEKLKIFGSDNIVFDNETIANDAMDAVEGTGDVLMVKEDDKAEDVSIPMTDDGCNKSSSSKIESKYDFIGKLVIEIDSCQIAKKTVLELNNCTKASVSYNTNVLNFYPNEESIRKLIIPNENDHRKWKSMIQADMGVVICVQSPCDKIEGFETKELCIWAYATTWGIYHDILEINGDGQLPTIFFELEVICTSNPIRFPALCKPVLRLCAIHYQDDIQSYPIRVKNSSSTNIVVHWSIHNILDYRVSRKERPFKLDLWDASENVKDWGLTLNPYYGNVYLDTFSVNEPYFRLKAWSERTLTLNINPCDVQFADDTKIPIPLNAVLVGCVFRDPEYEQKHPKWDQSRLVGIETAHLLVKVKLDRPKLVLLHDEIENMLQFFVRGEKLWNSKIYKLSKKFVWQNQSSVSTNLSIDVEEPYSIEFHQNGIKLNNFDHQICLKNGETVEMLMKLKITDGIREIKNILEETPLTRPLTQAEEQSGPRLDRERKIVKKMEIFFDGKLDQAHNIELFITLPKFKLSTRKVMFNSVFNGTTKGKTFDIVSEDCYPISFEIVPASPIPEEENVFSFYPSSGVVTSRKVPSIITIYFKPKFSIFYRSKFLVKSSIPSHELPLVVSGHGTYNSKHMGNEFPPKEQKSIKNIGKIVEKY